MKNRGGMWLFLICVTLWSFTGLLSKLIPWNAFALAGWRALVAGLMLFGYMKKRGMPLVTRPITLLIGVCVAAAAVFCLAAHKLTTAANAIVLQYTAPVILVALSALVYKRRFALREYVLLGCTMVGIVLFFLDKLTAGNMLGNLCALGCGVTYAGMYLFSGEVEENARLSGILWGFAITFAVGAPVAFFTPCELSLQTLGMTLLMGAVFYGLPYILYAMAFRTCPPLAGILISCVEIILNPVWVYLFLGERPGFWALIGSAVIITAVTVNCILNTKEKGTEEPCA